MRVKCGWFDVIINYDPRREKPENTNEYGECYAISVTLDASVSDSHICQQMSMSVGEYVTPRQAHDIGRGLIAVAKERGYDPCS